MKEEKKVAIVTGAGTGVGKAVVQIFLQHGYRVALAGRRKALLGEVVSEVGADPDCTLCQQTDVTRDADVDRLFDALPDSDQHHSDPCCILDLEFRDQCLHSGLCFSGAGTGSRSLSAQGARIR